MLSDILKELIKYFKTCLASSILQGIFLYLDIGSDWLKAFSWISLLQGTLTWESVYTCARMHTSTHKCTHKHMHASFSQYAVNFWFLWIQTLISSYFLLTLKSYKFKDKLVKMPFEKDEKDFVLLSWLDLSTPQIDHINIGLHYLNCFLKVICLQHLHPTTVCFLVFEKRKEVRRELEFPAIFLFEICHVF